MISTDKSEYGPKLRFASIILQYVGEFCSMGVLLSIEKLTEHARARGQLCFSSPRENNYEIFRDRKEMLVSFAEDLPHLGNLTYQCMKRRFPRSFN